MWSKRAVNRREFLTTVVGAVAASCQLGSFQPLLAEKVIALDARSYTRMRRYVQLESCRVTYFQQGRGKAALFLHGFPLNSFQWRDVRPRLAHRRRRIAPDFMGLGYTETEETQEITPETQAEMLAEFLDVLTIKAVDIVANDHIGRT
jgi:haloalkane dehalogenase